MSAFFLEANPASRCLEEKRIKLQSEQRWQIASFLWKRNIELDLKGKRKMEWRCGKKKKEKENALI